MLDFTAAHHHFKKVDPQLAALMSTVLNDSERQLRNVEESDPGGYPLRLYRAIISQQISTKAAAKLLERFLALAGSPVSHEVILNLSIDDLRAVGLSRQKASYILSIAETTNSGAIAMAELGKLQNEEVIAELTKIKGVGRWTAEMFLMFTLARPDVFSSGDLGLLNATRRLYNQPELTAQELAILSEKWSPHRTTAALVLWHSLDNKPA